MPQFQERHKSIVNKGENCFLTILEGNENLCQKRHNGTVRVPDGTIGSFGLTTKQPRNKVIRQYGKKFRVPLLLCFFVVQSTCYPV